MYRSNEYDYLGHKFWENGCGPSSIANAFISGFDITDANAAAELLRDVMHIMSGNPRIHQVDIKRFPLLAENESVILQYCENNGWEIVAYDKQLTPEELLQLCEAAPIVILSKQVGNEYWKAAIQYAQYLYEHDQTDATLYLVRASVGVTSTGGPLAIGQAGHFVTFCMPVKNFIEEGSIYLIDSATSALPGEAFGKLEYYKQQYPFVAHPWMHKAFLQRFGTERIHPNIVRFYLLDPSDDKATAANLFKLYGTTFWIFFIK